MRYGSSVSSVCGATSQTTYTSLSVRVRIEQFADSCARGRPVWIDHMVTDTVQVKIVCIGTRHITASRKSGRTPI